MGSKKSNKFTKTKKSYKELAKECKKKDNKIRELRKEVKELRAELDTLNQQLVIVADYLFEDTLSNLIEQNSGTEDDI